MRLNIPGGVKRSAGVAPFGGAVLNVVLQWVDACLSDVWICFEIPGGVEERIGVAPFGEAVTDEMIEWLSAGGGHVRVSVEIPLCIEQLSPSRRLSLVRPMGRHKPKGAPGTALEAP